VSSSLFQECVRVEGIKDYGPDTRGMNYKPMTIVNDDSRVVNKLDAPHTDAARVIIYNRHMFIVQATAASTIKNYGFIIMKNWTDFVVS
jgi:hypothetical protein